LLGFAPSIEAGVSFNSYFVWLSPSGISIGGAAAGKSREEFYASFPLAKGDAQHRGEADSR